MQKFPREIPKGAILQVEATNFLHLHASIWLGKAGQLAEPPSKALINMQAKGQTLQANWQSYLHKALIENHAKGQTPHANWQSHLHKALIAIHAKGQTSAGKPAELPSHDSD